MKKYRQAALRAAAKAVLTCCILVVLMALPALAEGNWVAVWWLTGAVLAGNWAAGVLLKDRERKDQSTGGAEPRPYRVHSNGFPYEGKLSPEATDEVDSAS